jgi:hypothetical protein
MIIAICGHKFSGKSTVARLLHNATGYEIVSFADKLKDITCVLSGCTREDLEDYEFKENELVPDYLRPYCGNAKKPTFRAFLQYFGSEVMRGVNDNIWIDCTLSNASETKGLIISDCRFPNEAKAVKARGGIVIKVVRGGCGGDSHCSEVNIDMIVPDYTLRNDSTLENLVLNVDSLVRLLRANGKI